MRSRSRTRRRTREASRARRRSRESTWPRARPVNDEDMKKNEEYWEEQRKRDEQQARPVKNEEEIHKTGKKKKAARDKEPEKPRQKGEASEHTLAAARKRGTRQEEGYSDYCVDVSTQDRERYEIEFYLRYDKDEDFELFGLRRVGRAKSYEELMEATKRIADRRPLPKEARVVMKYNGIEERPRAPAGAASSSTTAKAMARPPAAKGSAGKAIKGFKDQRKGGEKKVEREKESETRRPRSASEKGVREKQKKTQGEDEKSEKGERAAEPEESSVKEKKFGPSPFE